MKTKGLESRATKLLAGMPAGSAVLVFAGGILIGGGIIHQIVEDATSIRECWAIGDLAVEHWVELLPSKEVSSSSVTPEIAKGVRASLDRLGQIALDTIRQEQMKRQGVVEALRDMFPQSPPSRR